MQDDKRLSKLPCLASRYQQRGGKKTTTKYLSYIWKEWGFVRWAWSSRNLVDANERTSDKKNEECASAEKSNIGSRGKMRSLWINRILWSICTFKQGGLTRFWFRRLRRVLGHHLDDASAESKKRCSGPILSPTRGEETKKERSYRPTQLPKHILQPLSDFLQSMRRSCSASWRRRLL